MSNSGTLLNELHMQENVNQMQNINATNFMGDTQYNATQTLQSEQAHQAQHNVHQAQHTPYYEGNPHMPSELPDIEYLTKKINDELPDDTVMGDVYDAKVTAPKDKKTYRYKFLEKMPTILVESLIILLVYVLISQPFVRDTIGKYIKQINPGVKGEVSLTGVIIYGIILVVLYSIIKKFLIK
uniref:Uncharacterized protein n=1 Tax=Mimivirus LCMiAC02 TaxID=2506609 RepID=A0A481Z0Y0_9VIRU|nr:MAG: hypothetical protein LCMiAC02_00030 [Mimivirus LCMiAC02]